MAKKGTGNHKQVSMDGAYIEGAGIVEQQPITETLEKNYMPYAMSVILSRALPEIDGFKPSHRKLLYTMYKMGLLNGRLTKSANIVGQTMRLNPHGDATIYETMVRLSRGYQALLHPYIESKGNFGRAYSRDMVYAASRYTEAKLAPICSELFSEIDKDTVDFVPNYDNTTKEPLLLPVTFPTVLVNANVGIAVSMASAICPFHLKEVCETTIGLIKDPNYPVIETLRGPDFPGGGFFLYQEEDLKKVYRTGRGTLKIRSRYHYDKANHCIDITEIPPTTTVEAIMDKIVDLMKQNKIREISDMRDETDLSGLKLTLDLKRGTDPDQLMRRLFQMTPLQDGYFCNFNVLVHGTPRVMGVSELLLEWISFRRDCVRRRLQYDRRKKADKLHLLQGLQKVLLDIDQAIRVIRETKEESEVICNLMICFGVDEIQAEYVAEIKLRHLNREYLLKRTEETAALKDEIAELDSLLEGDKKIDQLICRELREVAKKHGQPRKTILLYPDEEEEQLVEEVPDYPAHFFLTREGYFKKITPQSLRMNAEQKCKDGDEVIAHLEGSNRTELLFFTNQSRVYKTKASQFVDSKASVLGDFLPAFLEMEEGERPIAMVATVDYHQTLLFFFENGRVAKTSLSSYRTKTNRKRLAKAYWSGAPLVAVMVEDHPEEYLLRASNGRTLLLPSALLSTKVTRDTQGVQVLTLAKGYFLHSVACYQEGMIGNSRRFRPRNLPSRGLLPRGEDISDQLKL